MKQYNISVYPKSFKDVAKCDIPSKIINKSIASYKESVTLKELAKLIENKHVWTPATFVNGEKRAENVESMQLFAIDIDGGLEYDKALERAEKYCLPVALSYETLSSVNFSKYRLVFACNDKITDKPLIQLMLICFCIIFHEATRHLRICQKCIILVIMQAVLKKHFSAFMTCSSVRCSIFPRTIMSIKQERFISLQTKQELH